MLSSVGRINQQRLRTGRLQDDGLAAPDRSDQEDAFGAALYRRDGGADGDRPARAARRLARTCGKLGLIVIDYLQLMRPRAGQR